MFPSLPTAKLAIVRGFNCGLVDMPYGVLTVIVGFALRGFDCGSLAFALRGFDCGLLAFALRGSNCGLVDMPYGDLTVVCRLCPTGF